MTAGSFVPVLVMHRLAMKLCPMIRRMLSTRRHRTMVAMPIVKMMIHVSVESMWPVEPRSGADKDTPCKPLRSVIPVWCAIIRRSLVVTVWANRRCTNFHGHLCRGPIRRPEKQAGSKSRQTKVLQHMHSLNLNPFEGQQPQMVVQNALCGKINLATESNLYRTGHQPYTDRTGNHS
jgi:hypothetical protein